MNKNNKNHVPASYCLQCPFAHACEFMALEYDEYTRATQCGNYKATRSMLQYLSGVHLQRQIDSGSIPGIVEQFAEENNDCDQCLKPGYGQSVLSIDANDIPPYISDLYPIQFMETYTLAEITPDGFYKLQDIPGVAFTRHRFLLLF